MKKYPSIVMGKRPIPPIPPFVAASSSFSALTARNSASDFAPSAAANLTPSRSACSSGTARNVPRIEPLSPIAPAIKPFDKGEAIWALTETEPADSPAIVTRRGSPPKAAMFRCTHRNAAFWSSKP